MATVYTNAFGTLCFTMMKESVPVSALSACGLLNARGPVMAAVVQSVFSAIAAWKNGAAAVYDLCVGGDQHDVRRKSFQGYWRNRGNAF